jgi:RHS repeat-associated protein
MKQKFTGKERDTESGLDYFGARYYGAVQGRFTSPDPLLSSGQPHEPQSWNRYAYTLNRPTTSTDPLGLFVWGNITEDQKEKFRSALKAAQADLIKVGQKYGVDSKQYKEAERAIKVYGEENKDNGVTVSVGKLVNANASGETLVSNKVGPKTKLNPTGQRINIKFSQQGINSKALEETVVHEGSHGADGSAWVAGGFKNSPTHYQTEFRAFMAESAISEVAHPNETVYMWLKGVHIPGKNPYLPERNYLWNPSWKAADVEKMRIANINSLLAHPKAGGGYGISPTNQGGPAFRK